MSSIRNLDDLLDRCEQNYETGCWEWVRAIDSTGYGAAFYAGKKYGAHRLAAELSGKLTAGGVVCHACDNIVCCNPDHLFVGTQRDNIADSVAKGRHNGSKPRCPQGHEYTTGNTRLYTGGNGSVRRHCRKCSRERAAFKACSARYRGGP